MTYQVPDEPRASRFNHLAVSPNAPLLAAMLCGGWIAWPWFAFNAVAIGSPTRTREWKLCAIAFAGTIALAAVISVALSAGWLESITAIRLAVLAVATWKLSMAWFVSHVQSRTFEVYRYYGGVVRSAGVVLIAGYYLRSMLIGSTDDPFWIIILLGGP